MNELQIHLQRKETLVECDSGPVLQEAANILDAAAIENVRREALERFARETPACYLDLAEWASRFVQEMATLDQIQVKSGIGISPQLLPARRWDTALATLVRTAPDGWRGAPEQDTELRQGIWRAVYQAYAATAPAEQPPEEAA